MPLHLVLYMFISCTKIFVVINIFLFENLLSKFKKMTIGPNILCCFFICLGHEGKTSYVSKKCFKGKLGIKKYCLFFNILFDFFTPIVILDQKVPVYDK